MIQKFDIKEVRMDIESVMKKYETQLMGLPNVTGVGIGEKKGKEVIIVFVKKRVSEAELKFSEIIPKTLDGYKIDVEEEIRVG
jgi:hypothetical protein